MFHFSFKNSSLSLYFLEMKHTNRHMMQEFIKLLNCYKIGEKLFEIIIDNVNNSKILKNESNKTLNRHEYI